jgi:hypothetical protein
LRCAQIQGPIDANIHAVRGLVRNANTPLDSWFHVHELVEAACLSPASVDPFFLALIYGFHGFHNEGCKVIHRTRTDAAVQENALFANALSVLIQVRLQQVAVDVVNGIDQFAQVHFHAAVLAKRGTGRPAWRSFHASTANLIANLLQILRQFRFGDHVTLPFKKAANRLTTLFSANQARLMPIGQTHWKRKHPR